MPCVSSLASCQLSIFWNLRIALGAWAGQWSWVQGQMILGEPSALNTATFSKRVQTLPAGSPFQLVPIPARGHLWTLVLREVGQALRW